MDAAAVDQHGVAPDGRDVDDAHGPASHAPPWRALDVAVLTLLCAAMAWPYVSSELCQDAVRDLLVAGEIATGRGFPLAGPTFNLGAFALGPIWFYVLALPSALGLSLASSTGFVGVLSALTLPLAFRFGVRAVDRGFAWCVLAVLCWPGLPSFQWLWWSSPNVLGTCLWASASCALIAVDGDRDRWWIASAAFLGLAIHAHPTALLYAPVLVAVWLRAAWRWRSAGAPGRIARTAIGMVAACLLWLAPVIGSSVAPATVAAVPAPSAMLVAALPRLAALPVVIGSLLWFLPMAAWHSWLPAFGHSAAANVAATAWLLAIGVGLLLPAWRPTIARDHASRRILPLAATAFLVAAIGLVIVTTMRPWVAFYTLYALVPAGAIVAASGLALLERRGGLPGAVTVGALVLFALTTASTLAIRAGAANVAGLADLPLATMGDLARVKTDDALASLRIRRSPGASATFARWLCDGPDATAHGPLAVALHEEQGLFLGRACTTEHTRVLGKAGGRHVVAMPSRWLARARVQPLLVSDGIGLATVEQVVAAEESIPATPPDGAPFHYAEEVPDRRASPVAVRAHFVTRRSASVLLTFLQPWSGELEVLRVTRDGVAVAAAERALGAWLWIGEPVDDRAADGEVAWELELRTDLPRWLDVVTF